MNTNQTITLTFGQLRGFNLGIHLIEVQVHASGQVDALYRNTTPKGTRPIGATITDSAAEKFFAGFGPGTHAVNAVWSKA